MLFNSILLFWNSQLQNQKPKLSGNTYQKIQLKPKRSERVWQERP